MDSPLLWIAPLVPVAPVEATCVDDDPPPPDGAVGELPPPPHAASSTIVEITVPILTKYFAARILPSSIRKTSGRC